jgi:hypothetical protein
MKAFTITVIFFALHVLILNLISNFANISFSQWIVVISYIALLVITICGIWMYCTKEGNNV